MDIQLLKRKIKYFWEWFTIHEEKFRIIEDPEEVRELLDNQVLQFGVFSWEIGEGFNKPHTFTISPNGNAKMLQISEALIGEAPDLLHWEFYGARPARDWDFTFEMYDDFMVKRKIDAAEWKYLLRITPDRKLRILLYAEQLEFLDLEDQLVAAQLVINNSIGEVNKIYFVESIVFISLTELPQPEDMRTLPELRTEFEQLVEELF